MPASTTDGRRVVVRADAGAAIGLGHVMRSLALGHELARAGWAVTFVGSGVPADAVDRDAIDVVAAEPVPDAAPVLGPAPDLVVVDGYHFTGGFFDELEQRHVPYVVIDDNGETPARRPSAVVNQNPHASPRMYDHLVGRPRLLLGTGYALIRRAVVDAAVQGREHRSGRVFVGFGGSDPLGLTEPVARALAAHGFEVVVAVGPAHPDRASVVSALGDGGRIAVAEPSDYVDELAASGAAVLGAGSAMWESHCLGVPTVAVVVAPNQLAPATAAFEQGLVGAVLHADDRLVGSVPATVAGLPGTTGRAGPGARPACDGARRVATALGELPVEPIRLRAATMDDAGFLFELRTDPEVDRNSFGPAPTWPEHLGWLQAALADDACRLMIAEEGRRPIGQVRLDRRTDDHVLSLALVATRRRRGLGPRVIDAATEVAGGDVVARIATGNLPSAAAFRRAGFDCVPGGDGEVLMRRRRDRGSGGSA